MLARDVNCRHTAGMPLLLICLLAVVMPRPAVAAAKAPARKAAKAAAPVVTELTRLREITGLDASRSLWLNRRFVRVGAVRHSKTVYKQAVAEHSAWTVLDAETYATAEVVFPLGEWSYAHAELWYGGKPYYTFRDRALSTMDVDLVDYDAETKTAAFVVSNWNGVLEEPGSERRHFYVEWNLEAGREAFIVPLGTRWGTRIGYDPGRTRYYLSFGAVVPGGHRTVLAALDLGARKLVELTTIEVLRAPNVSGGSFHPNHDWSKFAFAEYTEKSWLPLEPPGKMVFIDAKSGESFAMDAPVSPYGVAWSKDGGEVFVGSNELRSIDRYDLATRTITPVAKGLGRIAMFALSPSGSTLFVFMRNRAIGRYGTKPFAPGKPIELSSLFAGQKFYGWDWTTVSPDGQRLLLSKNRNEEVAWVDEDNPAMYFYGFVDPQPALAP